MKHDLAHDIMQCRIITEKVKNSEQYSQHLYAAMCNNEFQKQELVPVMRNEAWSCSWRRAGGIVSDIRGEGSYIDWYCSGMHGQQGYVEESVVTSEIRHDLKNIGWAVLETD